MMMVKNRLVDGQGNLAGFLLEDDGNILQIGSRGMYAEHIIEWLRESGYKYISYDCDIISPDGINIKELASLPLKFETPEDETMFYDEDELALPESECLQYFELVEEQVEAYEFKQPIQVLINTREELERFLDMQQRLMTMAPDRVELRPINSFTAKEALYTVDEYAESESAKHYIGIMEGLRKWGTYESDKLIKYFYSQGVIDNTEDSHYNLIKGYTAWGIPGFNMDCYNVEITSKISKDCLGKDRVRTEILNTILSTDGYLHYRGDKIDVNDVSSIDNLKYVPNFEEEFFEKLNTRRDTAEVIECVRKSPKIHLLAISKDSSGYRREVTIDVDALAIKDSSGLNCIYNSMFSIRLQDGTSVSLSNFKDRREFELYTVARTHVLDLSSSKVRVAPANSSFEVMRNIGVSDYTALRYIAYRAGTKENNARAGLEFPPYDAVMNFLKGIPDFVCKELDIDTDEIEDLDIFDALEVVRSKAVLADESGKGISPSAAKIVEQLNLISNITNGIFSVDKIYEGQRLDTASTTHILTNTLLTSVGMVYDLSTITVADLINILTSGEQLPYDIDRSISNRENKYYGAYYDMADINQTRILQSTSLIYVTKIFREASNRLNQREDRPYAIECVKFDNTKGGFTYSNIGRIAEIYRKALDEALTGKRRKLVEIEIMKMRAEEIGCGIYMDIAFAKSPEALKYEYTINTFGLEVTVKLDFDFVRNIYMNNVRKSIKFTTLADYVEYEISSQNIFNTYCINATINPWSVVSKTDTPIESYPFGINYLKEKTLGSFGDSYLSRVLNSGNRVVELSSISNGQLLNTTLDLFGTEDLDDIPIEDLEVLIARGETEETFQNYYRRFTHYNNLAANDGKLLLAIPLRSDLMYKNLSFIDKETPVVVESPEYNNLEQTKDKFRFLTNFDRFSYVAKTENRITSKSYIEELSLNGDLRLVSRWLPLLLGTFKPTDVTIVSGLSLSVIRGGEIKEYKFPMADGEIKTLLDQGNIYQIGANEYAIKSSGKLYKMEA